MSSTPSLPAPRDLNAQDEAMSWLVTMQSSPGLSPEQRQAFEAWKSISENALAYSRVQQISEDFRQGVDHPEVIRKRKEIHAWVRARRRVKRRIYSLGIAACMVLLVGTSAIYSNWTLPRLPWQKPVEKVYATAIGQRSNVPLEDGSSLTLNTNTLAKVAYGAERSIRIERGQALFEVAKADERPFVVYAADRRVVATGTVFDVRLGSDSVEVALIEGTVTVEGSGTPSVMQPGERLIAKSGGPAVISRVSVDSITAWTTGKHIFKDTPLREALMDVNRYTDKPIVLGDASLAEMRINGVFPTGRPDAFAKAITQVNELAFSYDADGAIRLHQKN